MKRWKRRILKIVLVLVLLLAIALGVSVAYVHSKGLPSWARARLLAELERVGVTARCDRLWLDFQRGIVAENIMLSVHGGETVSGQAKELALGVQPTSWLWGRPVVESLQLTEAKFSATLPQSATKVNVEHASARARLASDGAIDLDALNAEVLGIQVAAHGWLVPPRKRFAVAASVPATSSAPVPAATATVPSSSDEHLYAQLVRAIQEAKFASKPTLHIEFQGDLSDPQKGGVRAEFACADAQYREWTLESLAVVARLEQETVMVEKFDAKLGDGAMQLSGRYDLGSGAFEGQLKSTTDVARFVPLMPAEWRETLKPAQFALNPQIDVKVRTEPLAARDLFVEGRVAVDDFAYQGVRAKHVEAALALAQKRLRATAVRIVLPDGEIRGEYEQQLGSGTFTAKFDGRVNVEQLAPFMGEGDRAFVRQFKFSQTPPHLVGTAQGLWGKPEAMAASGQIALNDFKFRTVPIESLTADVKIANEQVIMTRAVVKRPEGEARGTYRAGLRDNLFAIDFESTIDPHALKPVLDKNAGRFLDQFEFKKPPRVVGQMSGHWRDIRQLKFDGLIGSGPLKISGVAFTGGATHLAHADVRSRFTEFRLTRKEGEVRGEGVYDFDHGQATVKLTSTANPQEVAAVFGSKSVDAVAPYRFDSPPTLEMEGLFDFREPARDDLHVKIAGKQFHYWKLTADEVRTDLAVKESVLSLENFDAKLYGGALTGEASFELGKSPTPYRAKVKVAKCQLGQILGAMSGKPSKVEGLFSGRMDFTATTEGVGTIDGEGRAQIENGLIWDEPMFGKVSKEMAVVLPGLGYSRAREAKLTFLVSEGKLRTDDLVVDAGMTRLSYEGKYDLGRNNLDLDVEAHLLGATPVGFVGWVFKPLTKLFELHVGGKLEQPHITRPLYLPKELFPFLR